jgi:transposase
MHRVRRPPDTVRGRIDRLAIGPLRPLSSWSSGRIFATLDELKGPLAATPADNLKPVKDTNAMTLPATLPAFFVGCDVGKTEIVVFCSRDQSITSLANEPASLARFARKLEPGGLVICEATGGYEAALLDALVCVQYPVHRADARKVKAFIRSMGTLGKTDAIDARALARYGHERHDRLQRWVPGDKTQTRLHALVMARRDIVADKTAWSNRQKAPGANAAADLTAPILKALNSQLQAIDKAIAQLVQSSHLAARARILQAIPGIGATTAYSLIALMPELGALDRKQAAALAGLAPHPKQSGQSNAYRRVRGGRPLIRQTLFMAAMAAARYNPLLKAFYQRLIDNGKKPIVAITATMRKLITIANARIRDAN